MKYFFTVLLLAVLASGCTKKNQVEFTGTATDINEGSFQIKNINDAVICQTNIKAGKFYLSQEWADAGYYYMAITKPGFGTQVFDVYLEPGSYTITTNVKQPYKYPDIQSTAKIQNELTAFYHLSDTVRERLHKNVSDLTAQMNDPKTKSLPPAAYASLAARFKDAQSQELQPGANALSEFTDKYPDNEIAPRMMLNMNYKDDPLTYYKIYQKLSPAVQNSGAGKTLKQWLDFYMAKPAGK